MNHGQNAVIINAETAEEYQAAEPYRRFMKVLIDQETIPGGRLCLAEVRYPQGARCPEHSHEDSAEVYVVLEGELTATVDDQPHRLRPGQLVYIPPLTPHWAENRGVPDCRFMAIHAPPVDDILEVKHGWQKTRVG